jgi:xanthine dehydrogenase YagR molybdenum-binding subunit
MMFSEYLDFIQSGTNAPGLHARPRPPRRPRPSSALRSRASTAPSRPPASGRLRLRLQLPAHGLRRPRPLHHRQRQDPLHRLRRREKLPGVLLILDHSNVPAIFRNGSGGRISESRPPLSDDTVYYWGQYVALVVAETFEQANAAASAVRVRYAPDKFNVSTSSTTPCPPSARPAARASSAIAATATPPSPPLPSRSTQVYAPRRDPQPHGDARHRRRLEGRQGHAL